MSASCRLSSPPESLDRCNLWWTNASVGPDLSSCRIISLSATGEAVVSDLRNQKNPRNVVSRAQLNLQTHQCNLDHVMLWWAPELKDCFSVSGQFVTQHWMDICSKITHPGPHMDSGLWFTIINSDSHKVLKWLLQKQHNVTLIRLSCSLWKINNEVKSGHLRKKTY